MIAFLQVFGLSLVVATLLILSLMFVKRAVKLGITLVLIAGVVFALPYVIEVIGV